MKRIMACFHLLIVSDFHVKIINFPGLCFFSLMEIRSHALGFSDRTQRSKDKVVAKLPLYLPF
jgi:hypothetical protein